MGREEGEERRSNVGREANSWWEENDVVVDDAVHTATAAGYAAASLNCIAFRCDGYDSGDVVYSLTCASSTAAVV